MANCSGVGAGLAGAAWATAGGEGGAACPAKINRGVADRRISITSFESAINRCFAKNIIAILNSRASPAGKTKRAKNIDSEPFEQGQPRQAATSIQLNG